VQRESRNLGAIVGLLLVLLSAPAHAEDKEAGARKLYALGRFAEAAEIYAQLYAETLHPTYLRNVGRCYQGMGDADRAVAMFREYLRKAKDARPEQRAEVEGFIRELESARQPPPVAPPPRAAAPAPAASAPRAAPPSAPRKEPAPPPSVLVSAPPAPEGSPPIHKRWWFWTGLGVIAAGVGIAAAGGAFTSYRDAPCTAARCGP
jgi:tetratricopeptide (TPR) repeat protein